MELGIWHYFDTVSDSNYEDDLGDLEDYGSGVDLSIEGTGVDVDNIYSETSNVFQFSLEDNPSYLTFGFSDFTEFNSTPSSATVVMVYKPTANNPNYLDMSLAGKPLPLLTGDSKKWYLYNQTVDVTGIAMNYPSNLTLYIEIGKENTKYINIDYLAVHLN